MVRSFRDNLKFIGQIAVGGWGDGVVLGIIDGYLKKISYVSCYEHIRDNKDLIIPDGQIKRYQGMIKKIPLKEITTEQVLGTLQEKRPDLSDLIVNHPQGMLWLNRQVENVKAYLVK
jgi:hypothetical protein